MRELHSLERPFTRKQAARARRKRAAGRDKVARMLNRAHDDAVLEDMARDEAFARTLWGRIVLWWRRVRAGLRALGAQ